MLTIRPFEKNPPYSTYDPGFYSAYVWWEGNIWRRSLGEWAMFNHWLEQGPTPEIFAFVLAFIEHMENDTKKKFPLCTRDLLIILFRYC